MTMSSTGLNKTGVPTSGRKRFVGKMPKVLLENPFARWASIIAIIVSVCSLLTYCFKARAYVDDKIEKSEAKTAQTYATKESVQSMGDTMKTMQKDVKDILGAVGRLEGKYYGPYPQK